MKLKGIGWIAAAALAVGGSQAHALDSMSGSYAGKLSCKGYSGTLPTKAKQDVVIDVIDDAIVAARVTVGATQVGDEVRLKLIEDSAKPDKGKIAGVDCDLDIASLTGIAVQGDVTIKPESDKGTIKGTLLRIDDAGNVIDVCSFTVKRTTTTPPKFGLCPPKA